MAAITSRVKLGVGCMATFPQRHPALPAHQWTSLDVISAGRAWLAAQAWLRGYLEEMKASVFVGEALPWHAMEGAAVAPAAR